MYKRPPEIDVLYVHHYWQMLSLSLCFLYSSLFFALGRVAFVWAQHENGFWMSQFRLILVWNLWWIMMPPKLIIVQFLYFIVLYLGIHLFPKVKNWVTVSDEDCGIPSYTSSLFFQVISHIAFTLRYFYPSCNSLIA